MIAEDLVARADAALMPTYRRQPVAFVRGRGQYLYDADGREYLDCMAGISMINVGHAHPAVTEAIARQAAELVNCSNLYYTEPQIALAEWIRDRSLGGKVFFCNSGAEANEAALKLARRHGGAEPARGRRHRRRLPRAHHGGAVAHRGSRPSRSPSRPSCRACATSSATTTRGSRPPSPSRTCAIFLETIQGEVGVHPLEPGFIQLARELATRHGALLVIDEIQTGLSRTGPLFSYQELDVVPDVMCLAKSLGGGVPIGAIVAAARVLGRVPAG